VKKWAYVILAFLVLAWAKQPLFSRTLYNRQSLYHYIRVEESGNVRTLCFRRRGMDYNESQMDIDDPLRLVMHYSRLMYAGFLFTPEPKSILVVGMGGGTLSQVSAHYFPDAQVDSVEIDPEVVEVAKKYFRFREEKNMDVFVRDGRVHVKSLVRRKAKYDVIMLDAFRGGYIPYHLTTQEFLRECQSILSPGGVVVSNLRPGFRLYGYQRRTFAKVFKSNYAFGGGDNKVLVSIPLKVEADKDELYKRAEKIQESLKLSFSLRSVVDEFDPRTDYPAKGEILLDGHAPVNILRSQPLQ
jgi:spermidine synthase